MWQILRVWLEVYRKEIIAVSAIACLGLALTFLAITLDSKSTSIQVTRQIGHDQACTSALNRASILKAFATGEIAAFTVTDSLKKLPDLAFSTAEGSQRTLSSWRGKTVLLNLWATWCLPCRTEMPALNLLQKDMGSDKFEVVAINIDTRDPQKPKDWLKEAGINNLAFYADPTAKVFPQLKSAGLAIGMPTTLLMDPEGCLLGVLHGPADWGGKAAKYLIREALKSD